MGGHDRLNRRGWAMTDASASDEMNDEAAKEKKRDAGLLAQAAEPIGDPLLDDLEDVSFEDRQRIADALVKAANAGWNLAVQRRLSQIENQLTWEAPNARQHHHLRHPLQPENGRSKTLP